MVSVDINDNTSHSGLSHIFHASFITPKQKFFCSQVLDSAGGEVAPPWEVQHDGHSVWLNGTLRWHQREAQISLTNFISLLLQKKYHFPSFMFPHCSDMPEKKKLLGHCVPGCSDYSFDPEFWEATLVTGEL